jgi:PIN domain nuclease of toxin-antitoxin system
MKYLLDTHSLLWYLEGSNLLSENSKNIIDFKSNNVLISISSLWEISIKNSIGKLPLLVPLIIQKTLPFHHKDPFDRILISQSIAEKIDIISVDTIIDKYLEATEINRIW